MPLGTRGAEADQCLRCSPCWPAWARCSSAPPRCAARTTSRTCSRTWPATIGEVLGYRAVVVNVYRPAFDDMFTAAAVGSADSLEQLLGLELAQRDLDAAVHAALRAQRRVLHPGRRVRLGWARRRDLRARSAAERRSRRLAAGRRAVRAAARRAHRDPRRDLGRRARDRAPRPPRTSSRRWSRSRGTPRWRSRSPRTAPTTCSTSACSSGCSRCRRGWPRPRTWTPCCRPSATASRTRSASTRS